MEELILHAFLSYANYVEFATVLDNRALQESSPKHYKILQAMRFLFSNQKSPHDLTVDEVEVAFYTYNSNLPLKEQAAYKALFVKIRKVEGVSGDALRNMLESFRVTNAIRDAMILANEVVSGRKRPEDFLEFVANILPVENVKEVTSDFLDMSLANSTTLYHSGGLEWKLKTMRAMFGRLRLGDFGFIFARPDVGKTTFITDQCGYMAEQGDGMVIHFNNEEAGYKIKNRYYQSILAVTTKELMGDYSAYEKEFADRIQGRIQIVDDAHMHRRKVEKVLERYKPKLIILDSIDKIWGFGEKGLRDDLHYKAIYQWARELAKEYGPVIGSCHASADGANTKWLSMENIAYAKTAKQGEADWILGIGASSKLEDKNMRYLSACKNKQMGDEEAQEKYRRGKLPVRMYPEIGQYEDYMEFN